MAAELDTAPAGAALLVIYRHYVALNGRAMKLLGISRDVPYVCFQQTPQGWVSVMGTTSPSGHRVQFRCSCGRISSTALARWLGHHLQGQGTYRIQEECRVYSQSGEQRPCYEIFFRRYLNQRDYVNETKTITTPAAPGAGQPASPEARTQPQTIQRAAENSDG